MIGRAMMNEEGNDRERNAADYRPPAFSSRRSSGWRSEERLSSTDTTIAQTARPMKKYSATTGEEARSMMWPTTIGTVKSPMFCTQDEGEGRTQPALGDNLRKRRPHGCRDEGVT